LLVIQPPLLSIRARGWKPGLDSIVTDQIFVLGFFVFANVGYRVTDLRFTACVQLLADRLSSCLIHKINLALKGGVYRPVI
jgi:hypothetical protein